MCNQSNVRKASQCGFTLIELLIALSLLAFLLMLSVQGYQHIKATVEARIVLNRLIILISYARSEAIRTGHRVTICKSKDGNICSGNWSDGQIVFINKEKPQVLLIFGPIKKTGQLRFRGFQSSDFLRFTPSGATFEQNGSFIYCMSQTAKVVWTLIIEKSGRVRVS